MPKRIYFISGLGADKSVFKKLMFPADYELIYLDWITPLPTESLEEYAIRLSANIDSVTPFYLVGLSFGGMLATEIAKQLKPVHTYIISSTPVYSQIPWYYRLAGNLRLHQILSLGLAKRSTPLMYSLFGLKTQNEKAMLSQIIADTDPVFLKWALNSILHWRNIIKPVNLIHIHGTSDKILPIKYTQPDVVIDGGGHLMVYTHAQTIRKIIDNDEHYI